jgi:pyrroloquinoline quinone (PQQ) biosynthesis protein C
MKLMKQKLDESPVSSHKFLSEFLEKTLTKPQLKKFAVQWYKTARDHKLAFPAIILNTPIDDVRFELIEILDDEYGKGDRNKIHAKLLYRFVKKFYDSDEEVERVSKLPAVAIFGKEVMEIWKNGNHIYAFGLHFALEYLAQGLHAHFSDALVKYPFLSEEDREYFLYHKIAEQQHADFSEYGFLHYATCPENQELLEQGIEKGTELLLGLWDEFYIYIFDDRKNT